MTVRFAQESLSAFSKNCCPLSARTAVRFHQEYANIITIRIKIFPYTYKSASATAVIVINKILEY
jgi:hypothetical protein